MFKDMAVAPNDELVDNVFFAVRPAKVATGAQTRIRVKPGTTRRKRKDGRPIIQSEMNQSIRDSATTMRPHDAELLGATNKPLLNTIDPKRGFARSQRRTDSALAPDMIEDEDVSEVELVDSQLEEYGYETSEASLMVDDNGRCLGTNVRRRQPVNTGNEPGIHEEKHGADDSETLDRDDAAYDAHDSMDFDLKPPMKSLYSVDQWLNKAKLMKTLVIDGANPNKNKLDELQKIVKDDVDEINTVMTGE
jgi:hypothetical protein